MNFNIPDEGVILTIQNHPKINDRGGDASLFVHPDRKLKARDPTVLHRDDEMLKVYKSMLLMATGYPVNIVVTGLPGCGKSHLIDSASRMAFPTKNFTMARIGTMKDTSRKKLYSTLISAIERVEKTSKRFTIDRAREFVSKYTKKHPVIMIVDDVDAVDRRFKSEFFALPSEIGVSLACTSRSTRDEMNGWETMHLYPYTGNEMKSILSLLVRQNIKKNVVNDDLPVDILINHVIEKLQSDVKMAVKIMEEAIILVEDRYLFKERNEANLFIIDIEDAIEHQVNTMTNEKSMPIGRNFTASVVFSIVCFQPGLTIDGIHVAVEKVMKKSFPDKNRPARTTIGNILRNLRDHELVMGIKNRPEKTSGVITTWHPFKSKKHLAIEFLSTYAIIMMEDILK